MVKQKAIDLIVDGMGKCSIEHKKRAWVQSEWDSFENKIGTRKMHIVTMTFCIRPSGDHAKARSKTTLLYREILKLPGAKVMQPIQTTESDIVKRGRKRKVRQVFPNLAGENIRVMIDDKYKCTFKVFTNGSIQVCGCPSFSVMKVICDAVEEMSISVFKQGITVSINNISMMCDLTEIIPGLLPNGQKLSCYGLSRHLNLESDEWDESNFHSQQRQTNLNLWYNRGNKKYYASVYPKGCLRITSSDADVTCDMVDSIVTHLRSMKLTDLIKVESILPEQKWPQNWQCTV